MEYYILSYVLLISLISFFIQSTVDNNNKSIKLDIFASLIFFLSSIVLIIRDPMEANDSINYKMMYSMSGNFYDAISMYHGNYAFSLTMFIGNYLSLNYETYARCLSILMSFITLISFRNLCDNKKHYVISFSFFVISSSFILMYTNVMRQGLALCLILYSISMIIQGKYLFSIVFLIISLLSHSSSLVFLIAIPIALIINSKIDDRKLSIIISLSIPIFYVVGLFVVKHIPLQGLLNRISTLSQESYNNSIIFIKVLIIYFCVLACSVININLKSKNIKLILCICLLTLLSISIFSFSTLFASRMLYYISVFSSILFAKIIIDSRNSELLKGIMILCFIFSYGTFVFSYDSTASQLGINLKSLL